MTGEGTVTVVVPGGVDDPLLPSGGNTYDRRLVAALTALGWSVDVRAVPGAWPHPDRETRRLLGATVERGGPLLLVDGLVACAAADALVPVARRRRLVVLLHLPLGCVPGDGRAAGEREVLVAAAAVVTTSRWSREWVLSSYGLDPARVHVAHPGADPAAPTRPDPAGRRLLSVGAVTPHKGHDVLLGALAAVADRAWESTWVGPLTRDPGFVAALDREVSTLGLADRVQLVGTRTGAGLDRCYAAADLLVVPSRLETYGMVVTEALAHGLPVVVSDVGGTREALGSTDGGRLPGLLVPAGDPVGLGEALASWLDDAGLRRRLRAAAARRRTGLPTWSGTAHRVSSVLAGVAEVAA